ncbi:MAG: 7TM diverse intracellular signaling domain-containing protein [Bacteroidota bacterium]
MSVRSFFCFLFPIFLCFISIRSAAQQNVSTFYLYEDSAKQLSAEKAFQLFEQGKYTLAQKKEYNIGYTGSVFWLAYINPTDKPADSLVLLIGHNHINRIHFFFKSNDTVTQQWITGDYFPFSQRPINATGFYFPVTKKGTYLARIDKSNESLQLSFAALSQIEAMKEESDNKSTMLLLTGMILLLLIFGLYLFIIEKERVYLYYILFIGTGWLWVFSNAGYGFQYLWPGLPWFASKARPLFSLLPLIFSMLFLVRYIGGIHSKKIHFLIKVVNVLFLFFIGLIFCFNESGYQSKWWLYLQYLIPLNPLMYILLVFGILITASIRGNKLAMFYLAANISLLVFGILQISFSLGSLNGFDHFFSHYGMAFGYVVEAIILTAGLVYRFNRYRVDKELLLLEMNRQQHENTRILIEVQESERSQIATQLHDVAGSLLSAAKLNLSSLREKGWLVNSQSSTQLEKTEEAVTLVSNMVRDLSHALSPVMLEQVGFKTSLEKVVAIFNASGKIQIELQVIGFEKYELGLNIYYTSLYSIIYELLNNIVKHSGAKHALLQVTEHENSFTLVVEDDGIGFNSTEATKNLGMTGIESKINYFQGAIALDRNESKGMIVTIEIPISNGTV